ncbi:helix-turn-helix transcriptional regulator [Actinocrinis sp.]|uniref:helix-turn-helix domain-containing protein n=1 Tax=Actinocrinis sp. TaxID=1920516 RepID=UPI002D64C0A7|nr:helix-turn-helix transcriptional regulator [Actinocrinis sp.]HZP53868.1 helix-turn-helix transcriptional regulator [Actinocrinis sp.]
MDRDAERAQWEERRRRWGVWLSRELDEQGKRPADLARALGGQVDTSVVSRWRRGDMVPPIERLFPIARFLGKDPREVLRAAGYDAFADEIERMVAGTIDGVRASFAGRGEQEPEPTAADVLKAVHDVGAQIGDLIPQLIEGMVQNTADIEAVADVVHQHDRAIGETRDEVDEVRADVDALAGEAGSTGRALRGHIDDPRAHEEEPDEEH